MRRAADARRRPRFPPPMRRAAPRACSGSCRALQPWVLFPFPAAPPATPATPPTPAPVTLRRYLEACVDRYGLRGKIRFGAEAVRYAWDDAAGAWDIGCADGRRFRGRFGIVGLGPFKEPRWPDIPGLQSFQGTLMHSARWPEGGLESLAGKRVALLGTGASAIQIIPELAKVAAHLHVVQRTPAWVAPRFDGPYSAWAKAAFRHVPGALRLHRFWLWLMHEARYTMLFSSSRVRDACVKSIEKQLRAFIRHEVKDERLAAPLTPSYAPGCKRLLVSSGARGAVASVVMPGACASASCELMQAHWTAGQPTCLASCFGTASPPPSHAALGALLVMASCAVRPPHALPQTSTRPWRGPTCRCTPRGCRRPPPRASRWRAESAWRWTPSSAPRVRGSPVSLGVRSPLHCSPMMRQPPTCVADPPHA